MFYICRFCSMQLRQVYLFEIVEKDHIGYQSPGASFVPSISNISLNTISLERFLLHPDLIHRRTHSPGHLAYCIDTIITGSSVLREIRIRAHMGCLILCIGLRSLCFRCSGRILRSHPLHSRYPPHPQNLKIVNILIQKIIYKL